MSHKRPRFTKRSGRTRRTEEQVRLSPQEHEAYRRIILGGQRAAPGRLKAWARTLEKNLYGSETIDASDKYAWIANHTREYRSSSSGYDAVRPMTFSDAARIYVAGLRSREPELPTALEWQTAVAREVPAIPRFHYGYGVPGRMTGVFERPFIPILLPREYIPTIAEELADLIVPRDRDSKRRKVGEMIEAYFRAQLDGTDPLVPRWNSTAVYAVEQIVAYVGFAHLYQRRFGPQSEALFTAVNEIAPDVAKC